MHTLSLSHIAARLGISHLERRARIAHIRTLIITRNFPAPINFRIVKGNALSGAAAVHVGSHWDGDAIEAWFDRSTSAATRAHRDDAAIINTRAALAANAHAIAGRMAA